MSDQPVKTARRKAEPDVSAAPAVVWYESREKEPAMFEVDGIRPIRNFSNGHLEWEVPAERDALFSQHFFVQTARVVKKRV